jgi:hypothetical protein
MQPDDLALTKDIELVEVPRATIHLADVLDVRLAASQRIR